MTQELNPVQLGTFLSELVAKRIDEGRHKFLYAKAQKLFGLNPPLKDEEFDIQFTQDLRDKVTIITLHNDRKKNLNGMLVKKRSDIETARNLAKKSDSPAKTTLPQRVDPPNELKEVYGYLKQGFHVTDYMALLQRIAKIWKVDNVTHDHISTSFFTSLANDIKDEAENVAIDLISRRLHEKLESLQKQGASFSSQDSPKAITEAPIQAATPGDSAGSRVVPDQVSGGGFVETEASTSPVNPSQVTETSPSPTQQESPQTNGKPAAARATNSRSSIGVRSPKSNLGDDSAKGAKINQKRESLSKSRGSTSSSDSRTLTQSLPPTPSNANPQRTLVTGGESGGSNNKPPSSRSRVSTSLVSPDVGVDDAINNLLKYFEKNRSTRQTDMTRLIEYFNTISGEVIATSDNLKDTFFDKVRGLVKSAPKNGNDPTDIIKQMIAQKVEEIKRENEAISARASQGKKRASALTTDAKSLLTSRRGSRRSSLSKQQNDPANDFPQTAPDPDVDRAIDEMYSKLLISDGLRKNDMETLISLFNKICKESIATSQNLKTTFFELVKFNMTSNEVKDPKKIIKDMIVDKVEELKREIQENPTSASQTKTPATTQVTPPNPPPQLRRTTVSYNGSNDPVVQVAKKPSTTPTDSPVTPKLLNTPSPPPADDGRHSQPLVGNNDTPQLTSPTQPKDAQAANDVHSRKEYPNLQDTAPQYDPSLDLDSPISILTETQCGYLLAKRDDLERQYPEKPRGYVEILEKFVRYASIPNDIISDPEKYSKTLEEKSLPVHLEPYPHVSEKLKLNITKLDDVLSKRFLERFSLYLTPNYPKFKAEFDEKTHQAKRLEPQLAGELMAKMFSAFADLGRDVEKFKTYACLDPVNFDGYEKIHVQQVDRTSHDGIISEWQDELRLNDLSTNLLPLRDMPELHFDNWIWVWDKEFIDNFVKASNNSHVIPKKTFCDVPLKGQNISNVMSGLQSTNLSETDKNTLSKYVEYVLLDPWMDEKTQACYQDLMHGSPDRWTFMPGILLKKEQGGIRTVWQDFLKSKGYLVYPPPACVVGKSKHFSSLALPDSVETIFTQGFIKGISQNLTFQSPDQMEDMDMNDDDQEVYAYGVDNDDDGVGDENPHPFSVSNQVPIGGNQVQRSVGPIPENQGRRVLDPNKPNKDPLWSRDLDQEVDSFLEGFSADSQNGENIRESDEAPIQFEYVPLNDFAFVPVDKEGTMWMEIFQMIKSYDDQKLDSVLFDYIGHLIVTNGSEWRGTYSAILENIKNQNWAIAIELLKRSKNHEGTDEAKQMLYDERISRIAKKFKVDVDTVHECAEALEVLTQSGDSIQNLAERWALAAPVHCYAEKPKLYGEDQVTDETTSPIDLVFFAGVQSKALQDPSNTAKVYKIFDQDQDGYATVADFQRVAKAFGVRVPDSDWTALMKYVDEDGVYKMDRAEFELRVAPNMEEREKAK